MTPTSATGPTDRRRDGFTLVELMVVLVVVGLAAGAVILTAPDPRPTVAEEAERLAARLARGREEAVLSNRPVAARIDASGYGFSTFDGRDWTPLPSPYRDWRWGEGVVSPAAAQRVVFDATGGAERFERTVSRDGRSMTVRVDGAGQVAVDG